MHRFPATGIHLLLIGFAACLLASSFASRIPEEGSTTPSPTYLGFDLNTYPGDAAVPVLRKTFSFGGYWLNPPPGAKENTWLRKRQVMLSQGFGFLLLYNAPLSKELKSLAQ